MKKNAQLAIASDALKNIYDFSLLKLSTLFLAESNDFFYDTCTPSFLKI